MFSNWLIFHVIIQSIFNCRDDDGIKVIYISDIAKGGEQPDITFWKFETLQKNIKSGKVNLLRFNLLDIQVTKKL